MCAQPGCETSPALKGESQRVEALPILVLNAHSRCNCRCVMCDIWKRGENLEIATPDLERHRESLRRLKVEWVVLTGGEPLMHSDLQSLCMFFRELGIRLTLLTTGLLLARRAAEVAALFDDVIVSLDGPQPVHDTIRRVQGGFALIGTGVSAIHRERSDMRITARTTVQKANHNRLRDTVRSAQALGLNGISFLAADVVSEAFDRPVSWTDIRQNEIAISIEELAVLHNEVEALIEDFAVEIGKGYISERAPKLRGIVRHFEAHLGLRRPSAPKCNAPWVSAVIEVDGRVRPCFFHDAVGSLQGDTLDEVINGEKAREFRAHLDIANNPVCQRCVCSLYRPRLIRQPASE